MRKRLLLILAIAAAIGFVTSYLVYQVVARVQAGPPSQGTETVVVAAANMSLGETITRQHVRTVSWPKASVPATALRSLDDADGRVVRSSIVINAPPQFAVSLPVPSLASITASVNRFAPVRSAVSIFGASPPRITPDSAAFLPSTQTPKITLPRPACTAESMPTIEANRTALPLRSIDMSRSEFIGTVCG